MQANPAVEVCDEGKGVRATNIPCPRLDATARLWWSRLAPAPDVAQRATAWLSAAETARAARFGSAPLRERYIIGRATLRLLLSETLERHPAAVAIERGQRGRPILAGAPDIDFNVSHTGDVAVYAIGRINAGVRLGIDVEYRARQAGVERLARKLLTGPERSRLERLSPDDARVEFLRIWTCKEAMSKATGDGLAAPFGLIEVDPGEAPRVIAGPGRYAPQGWALHRIPMPLPCIVTVALHQT